MRKLASIRTIAEIKPIEGADAIEVARVDGWWVVVKRGEYSVGDRCIYCEIDSWLPNALAPFLTRAGKEPREFNGIKGERLRTVKMRGQLSQGLILPIPGGVIAEDGADVSEQLGIQKWERPVSAQLQGLARGNFPSFIRKTDQERIQNLRGILEDSAEYEASVKLDGSSMTVYWQDDQMGVCSRNLDLKLDQVGNTFVDTAIRLFSGYVFNGIAIQGELMGPGIQGNRESLKQHEFFVFDVWDIYEQRYWSSKRRQLFCEQYGFKHVPIVAVGTLDELCVRSTEDALAFAEGHSINHPVREGVVFKRIDGQRSFKAISNRFLLGEK